MGEVESQVVRSDVRAGLGYVSTENLAQGRLQKVRRRVVSHDPCTPPAFDNRLHALAQEIFDPKPFALKERGL